MAFLKKRKNKKHGPESDRLVWVHVGEREPQFDAVLLLPASHLTRPRLAPLVPAAAADDLRRGGDVIRIKCRFKDFAEAVAWTAVEEAKEGRTGCGRVVVAPSADDAGISVGALLKYRTLPPHHLRARKAMMLWFMNPGSSTGDSEVITTRTPAQPEILRQNCKNTSSAQAAATQSTGKSAPDVPTKSWRQRISEQLLKVTTQKPSPQTPPPPATSFRPTWALSRRKSVPSSQ